MSRGLGDVYKRQANFCALEASEAGLAELIDLVELIESTMIQAPPYQLYQILLLLLRTEYCPMLAQ